MKVRHLDRWNGETRVTSVPGFVVRMPWLQEVTLLQRSPGSALVGAASALPAALGLQCSDPDDQKFLDLAHAQGAGWLLSRDRAVLKLARRAARFSLTITVPEGWSAP